jgi:hypothetical protein
VQDLEQFARLLLADSKPLFLVERHRSIVA